MDIQDHGSYQPRHAYHTADYQVSKREMAALWQRYYVWKAAKEKDSRHPDQSVTTIGRATPGMRRAYSTGSVATATLFKSVDHQPRLHTRRAYHHRPAPVQTKRLEASSSGIHITVS